MIYLELVGVCNRCGLCCVRQQGGEIWRCLHLVGDNVGQPQATSCSKYSERYDGMPIILMSKTGNKINGLCRKDSDEEIVAIMEKGIGKGCSLTPTIKVRGTHGSTAKS